MLFNHERMVADKQGCQMVYFQTKNPNLGKNVEDLKCKTLVYVGMSFGIFYSHLIFFMAIW
jgi:hypothetical protein